MTQEERYRMGDKAGQNALKAANSEVAALEATLIEAGTAGDLTAIVDGAAKLSAARERLEKVLAEANAEANAALERQLATAIWALVKGCDYETRNELPIDSIIWYCDRSGADPAKGIEPVYRVSINATPEASRTANGAPGRKTGSMRAAMTEILRREGPLHRREIHDRLVEMGVHVGGRDPVNNVGAHLSTDERFRNVGRGMWDLASSGSSVESEDLGDSGEESEDEDSVAW